MIIKKTVTIFSLLILSLVWQGTSLYGMFSRLAVQKSTGLSSRELSKLMAKGYYCGKETGPMKDWRKTTNILNKKIVYLKESLVRAICYSTSFRAVSYMAAGIVGWRLGGYHIEYLSRSKRNESTENLSSNK